MSMANKIRVLIGDDNPLMVDGIKTALENDERIEVAGEIDDPLRTSQYIEELEPDILLMDLLWWGDQTAGIKQIHHISTHYPKTKIIAITAYPELIDTAIQAGAYKARPKGFYGHELIEMILAVYESDLNPQTTPPLIEPLSDREIKVLKLMAIGRTDREIGTELQFAETTIKADVRNIYGKLNAKNRAEAVSLGHKLGILS